MILGPATLLTGGDAPQVLAHGAMRIIGAHIAAMGPYDDLVRSYPDETVWDTGHRVVLPGLVDALCLPHAVLGEGLAGYAGPGGALGAGSGSGAGADAIGVMRWLEDALDPDELYAATRAALVSGLRHGVTTSYLSVSTFGAGREGLAAVARAAQEVKARVCIAGAVTDRHGAARAQELLEENAALVEQAKKGWGDRLRAMLGLGALSETSPATLAAVAERARALGCGVYARVGATPSDADEARLHGSTPVGRLAHAGVLDARSVVGPGRHLPAPDWDLLRSTAAAWAATPREDADEHGVMLDFVDLAGRGLVPALGSGGLTPHLVGEAEMVYRGARLLGRPGAAGKRVAAQALLARGPELAQRHFVAGLGHLVPGSPADLVVLDAYPATPLGAETWADLLVQSLASARSHAVMVAGEILFADGRATVVDEREVQRQARAAVHRMWPRVAP